MALAATGLCGLKKGTLLPPCVGQCDCCSDTKRNWHVSIWRQSWKKDRMISHVLWRFLGTRILPYQLLQSWEDLASAEFSVCFDVAIPCHCTRVLRIPFTISSTRLLWQEPSLLWQVELWLGDRRRQGHGNAAACGLKVFLGQAGAANLLKIWLCFFRLDPFRLCGT